MGTVCVCVSEIKSWTEFYSEKSEYSVCVFTL